MAIVVSDTSPIRALAHLGRLDLLKAMFTETYVPPGVVHELENPASRLPPLREVYLPFVTVRSPVDQTVVNRFLGAIHRGEAEAIALALEMGLKVILVDDNAARTEAKKAGLEPVGVLGILLRAKARGLIGPVRPMLDSLRDGLNFFVSAELRDETLSLAGE